MSNFAVGDGLTHQSLTNQLTNWLTVDHEVNLVVWGKHTSSSNDFSVVTVPSIYQWRSSWKENLKLQNQRSTFLVHGCSGCFSSISLQQFHNLMLVCLSGPGDTQLRLFSFFLSFFPFSFSFLFFFFFFFVWWGCSNKNKELILKGRELKLEPNVAGELIFWEFLLLKPKFNFCSKWGF